MFFSRISRTTCHRRWLSAPTSSMPKPVRTVLVVLLFQVTPELVRWTQDFTSNRTSQRLLFQKHPTSLSEHLRAYELPWLGCLDLHACTAALALRHPIPGSSKQSSGDGTYVKKQQLEPWTWLQWLVAGFFSNFMVRSVCVRVEIQFRAHRFELCAQSWVHCTMKCTVTTAGTRVRKPTLQTGTSACTAPTIPEIDSTLRRKKRENSQVRDISKATKDKVMSRAGREHAAFVTVIEGWVERERCNCGYARFFVSRSSGDTERISIILAGRGSRDNRLYPKCIPNSRW